METGLNEMPKRLEDFWGNLNSHNLERRLFAMYKWNVGRKDASYDDFSVWLGSLSEWLETQASEADAAKNKPIVAPTKEVTKASDAANKETVKAPVENK